MTGPLFPGIGIGGYRSFGANAQLIGGLSRMNLVVGPNNTGKSNVLSLFYKHAAGLRGLIRAGNTSQIFDPANDPHRIEDRDPPAPTVLWAIDMEVVANSTFPKLGTLLNLEDLTLGTNSVWLKYNAPTLDGPWNIDADWAKRIWGLVRPIFWTDASRTLTSAVGGGELADLMDVLVWLTQHALAEVPKMQFIPAHRKISSTGADPGDTWQLSGEGLINRLDRLKNASFNERDLKRAYGAIRAGLAELLDVAECDYVVPRGIHPPTLELLIDGEQRPLHSFGTGFEHALLVVAATIAFPNDFFCIEEPEVHLHPRLQRQLALHLCDRTQTQLLISTHSAHMIDALRVPVFRTQLVAKATQITVPVDAESVALLDDLGYRASDILQANCIIWVEGPSDRIYLNAWISAGGGPDLVEGAHYVIMFYGGALLSRATAVAEGQEDDKRVRFGRIQQHFIVIADSDRRDDVAALKDRVLRIADEASENPTSMMWVTAGRTIENYVQPAALATAIQAVHPTVDDVPWSGHRYGDALVATKADGQALVAIDKVAIAEEVVRNGIDIDVLDLRDRVVIMIDFIRHANG